MLPKQWKETVAVLEYDDDFSVGDTKRRNSCASHCGACISKSAERGRDASLLLFLVSEVLNIISSRPLRGHCG